ncbi:MAG: hypothetical protein KDC42_10965 [Ignavibacteriae bacterium]|nr:hypothetical protein [Ignavibacteriota bacterium]
MKKFLFKILDIILIPIALVSAWVIYIIRKLGGKRLSTVYRILYRTGMFPTKDFFFEPPKFPEYLKEDDKK